MKRIIALLFLGMCSASYPITVPGSMIWEAIETDQIVRTRLQFVNDQAPYINGGLTFVYPFTFPNDPRVIVSIELGNGIPFDPAIVYSAVATLTLTNQCRVFVTKATEVAGVVTITEASTNEVIVTLLAIEYPF